MSLPRGSAFLAVLSFFCIWPRSAPAAPVFASLYSFGAPGDGSTPYGPLVIDRKGVLFGATYGGGTNGQGTVFSLTPPTSPGGAWTEAVLWSFGGTGDGSNPTAGVVIGAGGVLYGTTSGGGANAEGAVFALTPPSSPGGNWTESVLYSFANGSDGAFPARPLVIGTGGVLYGITPEGGTAGQGTVFSLTPPAHAGNPWAEAVLYSFHGKRGGGVPEGLIIGTGGVLYGATLSGGGPGYGVVFSLTPPGSPGGAWTEEVLHSFAGGADGASPEAGVVLSNAGVLYGTTVSGGGLQYAGTAFSLTPGSSSSWTEDVLHRFSELGTSGYEPTASLVVVEKTGTLYGTTAFGGNSPSPGDGTVFSLKPPSSGTGPGKVTVLHNFKGKDGASPNQALVLGSGVVFYGVTSSGGTYNVGTVFSLHP